MVTPNFDKKFIPNRSGAMSPSKMNAFTFCVQCRAFASMVIGIQVAVDMVIACCTPLTLTGEISKEIRPNLEAAVAGIHDTVAPVSTRPAIITPQTCTSMVIVDGPTGNFRRIGFFISAEGRAV
jgi:hypothetical protein